MTNAIEQTRREMYKNLESHRIQCRQWYASEQTMKFFEESLEAHLEELRKGLVALERRNDSQYESINILQPRLEVMTEERDTLRNKLQALKMASSTAAEVIRGLRSELEEARDGSNANQLHAANSLIQRQRMAIEALTLSRSNGALTIQEFVQLMPELTACQHSFHHMHEHCIYCGVRK